MKKFFAAMVVTAVACTFAACGGGTSSGKVLVEVNGTKITEGDLDFLGKMNPRLKPQIDNPAGRKRVLENLAEQEMLYQEAVKEGVNRDAEVKAKIDLYRKLIIADSLIAKKMEESTKKYYEANPEEFKKIRVSDIMVKFDTPENIKKLPKTAKEKPHTEKEALDIIGKLKARIDGGEEFEKVAKEGSEDIGTKAKGGDMGLVAKNDKRLESRGLAPVVEKAFELKVGEVAGPIKTPKGYYLVKVTRGIEPETFEQAKDEIAMKIRNDSRTEFIASLKKESKIEYPEEEKAKKELAKKKEEAGKTAPEAVAGQAPAEATGENTPEAKPADAGALNAVEATKAADAKAPKTPKAPLVKDAKAPTSIKIAKPENKTDPKIAPEKKN